MANRPEDIDLRELTSQRLTEIRNLLTYESSIAFYSNRAHASMWLLVEVAEDWLRMMNHDPDEQWEKYEPA